jgi:hypothetical protein
MKTRLVLALTAATIALSSAAFAATNQAPLASKPYIQVASMTPEQKCTSLEQQWKKDSVAQKGTANFATAEKLADEGTKLCSSNKPTQGIEKFDAAFKDIGIKPSV